MRNLEQALVGAVLAALAGCASTGGAPFDRHKAGSFIPGQTTRAEVVAVLGKPFHEQTYTAKKDFADKELPQPAIVNELRYFHSDSRAASQPADTYASRNAFYTFNSGTLMSTWMISTFAEDSTEFDEHLAAKLVKGKTTEAEVLKIFGKPAGSGVYPAARELGGRSIIYEVFLHRHADNRQTYKTLKLFLDKNSILSDYEVNVRSR